MSVSSDRFLATWLASLANVLVGAMPTQTGKPTHIFARCRIAWPSAVGDVHSPDMPCKNRKQTSIEYTSTCGLKSRNTDTSRLLMSPYGAKKQHKATMSCRRPHCC